MSSIKDLVENRHPIHKKYYNYWNFLLDSYEGGVDYSQAEIKDDPNTDDGMTVLVNGQPLENRSDNNLFKHTRESSKDI